MALQHVPAPSDGLTGNVEGLVGGNPVEVRVLFGASGKPRLIWEFLSPECAELRTSDDAEALKLFG